MAIKVGEDTQISLTVKTWIAIVSFVVIAISSAIGGYYVLTSKIDEASNSPASRVEWELRIELMSNELERAIERIEKLEEKVEENH